MYSTDYDAPLAAAAAAIGCNSDDLKSLIDFESSWDPTITNPSGAVGLIQFMPRTLQSLGLLTSSASEIPDTGVLSDQVKADVQADFLAQYPDAPSQLAGPVVQYLQQYAPYPTQQSLYMAVFYPAYRSVAPDTAFSAAIQAQNPGIDTVQDYLDLVKKKAMKMESLRRPSRPDFPSLA